MMVVSYRSPSFSSAGTELEIPSQLDAVVLACLEKDPARRPATAAELSRLLGEAVQDVWTAARATLWWHTQHPVPAAAIALPPSRV